MKKFFKYLLATMVGSTLGIMISFFISLMIIGGIMGGIVASAGSMADNAVVKVKPNSILKITLNAGVAERTPSNPLENFNWMSMQPDEKIGLNDILKNLKKAKDDDNIKGIYLDIDALPVGIATVQEIREALVDFKESGKFIIAYNDMFTQGAYYLVSVADKVYLNPAGLLELKGLAAEMMFFKGTLEKLGVKPQVIRPYNNKFKSAVEPFIYDQMTDANRKQTFTYMNSIWEHILGKISEHRGVSVDDLKMYADSMLVTNAQAALDLKLVDGLMYKDQILDELRKLSETDEKDDINYMGLAKYTNAKVKKKDRKITRDKIAVVYGTGEIGMGEGSETEIGSDGLSEAIREAREDSTVKAVVLRVNSPGGSALASEVIWREVVLTKEIKPVIVSMGDVAASGGYYIAAPADAILANETTITGSIGVFGVLWNGQGLLNDMLGITIDTVKTNAHSDIGSLYRPMTRDEEKVIQKEVNDIYVLFKGHVSDGRDMHIDSVHNIAQGRVWSGANAKEIGLIDEFGGLTRAIELAAEKAGLENYKTIDLPKQQNPFEKAIEELMGEGKTNVLLKKHLGTNYKYIEHLENAMNCKGIVTRMPYDVDIY